VAQQENPNGFPSDTRNQFAFDGFFGHQAYRPTGAAFGWTTAYHCNQTLFLTIVEHLGCAGPLFLIQGPIQTALLITAADVADGLRRQRNYSGNARRGGTLGQLQKSQGAKYDTDLLNSAAQQFSEFLLIPGSHFYTQGWTSHALVWAKTFPNGIVLLQKFQAVRDLVYCVGKLRMLEQRVGIIAN
jgi:hypothetical protein